MAVARYTLDQAARHLGISSHTVHRRVCAGQFRAEHESVRGGFRWVVLLDSEVSV